MKRPLRITLIILATLAGLLLIALLLGPFIVGRERLQNLATGLLQEHAGLELQLQQPPTLRLLPRPSLTAQGLAVHTPQGDAPMLEARRLEVVLALLPLFGGDVEAAAIRLEQPVLRLRRSEDGRWNWQSQQSAPAGQDAANGPVLATGPLRGANLHLSQGTLLLEDDAAGTQLELRDLDLKANLEMDGQGGIRVAPLTLSLHAAGAGLPWSEPAPLHLRLDGSYTPGSGASLQELEASLWGVTLGASLQAHKQAEVIRLQGDIDLDAPLAALQRLGGAPAPDTPLQGSLGLQLSLAGSPRALQFEHLALRLPAPQSREGENAQPPILEGSGSLQLLPAPSLSLALRGGALDATPLLALGAGGNEEATPPAGPGELLAEALGWSRSFPVQAEVELAALELAGLRLEALKLQAVVRQGALFLTPLPPGPAAHLAGGALDLELRADLRDDTAHASLLLELQDAQADPLLRRFMPQPPISGVTGLRLQATAGGADWETLAASLNGELELRVADGELRSADADIAARPFEELRLRFDINGFATQQGEAVPAAPQEEQVPKTPADS